MTAGAPIPSDRMRNRELDHALDRRPRVIATLAWLTEQVLSA
jgi:hypothetical protein